MALIGADAGRLTTMLLLCFPLHEDDLRSKTCRQKPCREDEGSTGTFPRVTVVVPWLDQYPLPQETYPLPTDDGNTFSCILGRATVRGTLIV